MFSFFQTIFQKITYVVTSIAVTVGLVSAPVSEPIVEAPIELVQEVKEKTRELIEKLVKKPEITPKQIIPPPVIRRVLPPAPELKSMLAPEPVPVPLSVISPLPPLPVKVLKVKADKQEMWASGFHYINFGFEYLVDGKSGDTPGIISSIKVSVEKIVPSASIPASWQIGVSTNEGLLFFTEVPGNHTLTFVTNTGAKAEITVTAKKWPDRKELEIVPVQTKNTYVTDIASNVPIPSVLVGSFKVRTNPDINIKLYDCNISTKDGTFGSYKIKIAGAEESTNNNCFNTLSTPTDGDGLSKGEFQVSVNNLETSKDKMRFSLKDIKIREFDTGIIHDATTTPTFDLEIIRE